MIAHSIDVCAATCVRLRSKLTTIGVKRHAENVWHHHPFVGVDVAVPHPVRKLLRIGARDECEIAEHHQAFDVVRIGAVVDAVENGGDAFHFCFIRVGEQRREWAMRVEFVEFGVFGHPPPVTIENVFAPTENLANKTFGAVDRHFAFGESVGCDVENFLWQEQTIVEIRREQRVCEMPV